MNRPNLNHCASLDEALAVHADYRAAVPVPDRPEPTDPRFVELRRERELELLLDDEAGLARRLLAMPDARKVRCPDGYGLFDTCPNCD